MTDGRNKAIMEASSMYLWNNIVDFLEVLFSLTSVML